MTFKVLTLKNPKTKMMKRMSLLILILILWLYHLPADAPPVGVYTEEPKVKKVYPFDLEDHTLIAFMWYESRFDVKAEQKVTKARGVLQILPVMINEANRICKITDSPIRYNWQDAWDVNKSIEIWYLVQNYHNPEYNLIEACKIWFGRGVQYDGKTWHVYYDDVLSYINTSLAIP